MKSFTYLISALCLTISGLSFTQASPLETRATALTPTRPFAVAAFESPFPVGQGVTGLNMTARGGNIYLSAKTPKAVFFTTSDGRAYLDSKSQQPVYIDTFDGHLGYASPAPVGAIFIDFLHRGHGTQIYIVGPNEGQGPNPGPADFQWIGSDNTGWFACPKPNGDYQVFKIMSNTIPNLTNCEIFFASAIDYTGPGPAVDNYA